MFEEKKRGTWAQGKRGDDGSVPMRERGPKPMTAPVAFPGLPTDARRGPSTVFRADDPVSMDGTHEGSAPGRLPRRDPVYLLVRPVNSGQAVFLCANLQTGLSAHCPPRLDRSAAIFFSSMSSISISCSLGQEWRQFFGSPTSPVTAHHDKQHNPEMHAGFSESTRRTENLKFTP